VVVRRGGRALVYRARARSAAVLLALVAVLVTGAVIGGLPLAGVTAAAVVTLAWLVSAVRVMPLQPAGSHGDGPMPPGGAGVREPRRPLPHAPAGAAAIPPTR
jgi:hypothetical protein